MSEAEPVLSDASAPEAQPPVAPAPAESTGVLESVAESHEPPAAPPQPTPSEEVVQHHWSADFNISPEVAAAGVVQSSKSFEDMVYRHENATKLIGRKGVIKPNWDDAADVARYYEDLGRPKTAKDYDLSSFNPREDIGWSQDVAEKWVEKQWEQGATQEQIVSGLNAYNDLIGEALEAVQTNVQEHREKVVKDLRRDWGSAYDQNMTMAMSEAKERFGDDASEMIQRKMANGTDLGDDPDFIRLLFDARRSNSEAPLHGDKISGIPLGKTPATAQKEIDTLMRDESFMKILQDRSDPEQTVAQDRMNRLYEQVHGSEEDVLVDVGDPIGQ